MKTKITVGIDNKPSEGLKGEWGSPEKDIREAARDFPVCNIRRLVL